MKLKNNDYDDIVLHNGSYSYQVPRGEVVEVPDRIGAKLLLRFPELEQVEEPATASCYHVPRQPKAAPAKAEASGPTFEAAEGEESEKEAVELMPGVKVAAKPKSKPRKGE